MQGCTHLERNQGPAPGKTEFVMTVHTPEDPERPKTHRNTFTAPYKP